MQELLQIERKWGIPVSGDDTRNVEPEWRAAIIGEQHPYLCFVFLLSLALSVAGLRTARAERISVADRIAAQVEAQEGIHLTFRYQKDAASKPYTFVPRPKAEMLTVLKRLRRPSLGWPTLSMRWPGIADHDVAGARKLAQSKLAEVMRGTGKGQSKPETAAIRDYALRILSVTGEAGDAQRIITYCVGQEADKRDGQTLSVLVGAVADLEARLGQLDSGILRNLVTGADIQLAAIAALHLDRLGITGVDAPIRQYLVSPWALRELGADMAFALIDTPPDATLPAMRTFLNHLNRAVTDKTLPAADQADWNNPFVPVCLYLTVHGGREDRKAIGKLLLGPIHAVYFSYLAKDPVPLARALLRPFDCRMATHCMAGFVDREDPRSVRLDLFGHFMAQFRAQKLIRQRIENMGRIASMFFATSSHFVNPRLSMFGSHYFEREEMILEGRSDKGRLSIVDHPWMPVPEKLSDYAAHWQEGDRRFEPQFEYITPETLSHAISLQHPARELLLQSQRVGTRAYRHPYQIYSDGLDHRPFVLRHVESTKPWGGTIAGIADLTTQWTDRILRLAIRLRLSAEYAPWATDDCKGRLKDGLRDWTLWEHHRYVTDDGRALLDGVTVRCGAVQREARDTGRRDDGYFVYEVEMDSAAVDNTYIDVHLVLFNQDVDLTFRLFADEAGRQHYQAQSAVNAAYKVVEQEQTSDAILAYAATLAKAGRVSDAAATYMHVLKSDINNVTAWRAAGAMYLDRRLYKKAIEVLDAGVRANTEEIEIWDDLARAYYLEGEYQMAYEAASEALILMPGDDALTFRQATALFFLGKRAEADVLLQEISADFAPQRVATLRYITAATSKRSDVDARKAVVEELYSAPADKDEYDESGLAALLDKVETSQPTHVYMTYETRCRICCFMGYSELIKGDRDAARKWFLKSIKTHRYDQFECRLALMELEALDAPEQANQE